MSSYVRCQTEIVVKRLHASREASWRRARAARKLIVLTWIYATSIYTSDENLGVCRRYVPRYCSPGSDVTYHRAGGVSAVVVM